jgi:hypothetical protein
VDDTPTQYNQASTHSLYIPDSELRIPLELDGIISGFTTRAPTPRELENTELHIEMSSDKPWNTNSKTFASAEDNAKDNHVQNRNLSQVSRISSRERQNRKIQVARVRRCWAMCQGYGSIELKIASRNDVLENDDVVLAPRLISAARIQPKNKLIVGTVMNEDDNDNDNDEGNDDEEPNMMNSMETSDVAAIRRGDSLLRIVQTLG